jgi:hypothetical protein
MGRLPNPSRLEYDAETLRLYRKAMGEGLYVTDGRRRRRVRYKLVLAYPVIEAYFYSGPLMFGRVSASATGWNALTRLMERIAEDGTWWEAD